MDRERLLLAFRFQAAGCRHFGSEFYAELLDALLEDAQAGGAVSRLVESWQGDPVRGFLPLRVLGAVHEQVLSGRAPELARHYPSAGGRADPRAAWPLFRTLLEEQRDALGPRLANFPQTNEVGRCAGLLGGFLRLARRTGLPLRLREIGCSAGLNLQWQLYRYALGPHRWGDPTSSVRISADWQGGPADFATAAEVESRAGCDLDPRRAERDEEVRILEAFVWPDQPDRMQQLRAAVKLFRRDPPRVDRAPAAAWLPAELDAPAEGVCRVVFHSSVWIYLEQAEQAALVELLEQRGAHATVRNPLAWLRHEDRLERPGQIEVRLRLWPPGEEIQLARSHPHGRRVEWLAASD